MNEPGRFTKLLLGVTVPPLARQTSLLMRSVQSEGIGEAASAAERMNLARTHQENRPEPESIREALKSLSLDRGLEIQLRGSGLQSICEELGLRLEDLDEPEIAAEVEGRIAELTLEIIKNGGLMKAPGRTAFQPVSPNVHAQLREQRKRDYLDRTTGEPPILETGRTQEEIHEMFQNTAIVSGGPTRNFAAAVAHHLGLELAPTVADVHKDRSLEVAIRRDVRGAQAYLIMGVHEPVHECLESLKKHAWALNEGGLVDNISLIAPYLEMRGDRSSTDRGSVPVAEWAREIKNVGVRDIIYFDPHFPQSESVFRAAGLRPTPMYLSPVLIPFADSKLQEMGLPPLINERQVHDLEQSNYVFVSPDSGAMARATKYAELTKQMPPPVVLQKVRGPSREIKKHLLVAEPGVLTNKTVLMVDDVGDSLKTLISAAEIIKKRRPNKIFAFLSHAALSDKAPDRLRNSPIDGIFTTNTIPHSDIVMNTPESRIFCAPVQGLVAEILCRLQYRGGNGKAPKSVRALNSELLR